MTTTVPDQDRLVEVLGEHDISKMNLGEVGVITDYLKNVTDEKHTEFLKSEIGRETSGPRPGCCRIKNHCASAQ